MDPHLNDLPPLHQMWHWMLDTWQFAVLMMTILTAWIMFFLRTMFVTRKGMDDVNAENIAAHKAINKNVQVIKEDISYIKGFIERQNGK